jgi:hypothetical protein
MEKKLRSDAGFPGTPIRLLWRSRRRPDKRGERILMHIASAFSGIDILILKQTRQGISEISENGKNELIYS